MAAEIIFAKEGQIGLVTLNRPEALNALTLSMLNALQEQLAAWAQDEAIAAVVVRASPGKAFCAGGDIRWLYEAGKSDDPKQMDFFWHEYRLNNYIHHYKKPYIALMDGITMGGGVGISLHGSHPVATERFVFAMPETGIGFFPDIGASYLLSRCPDATGVYLGLTGNRLNAGEAQSLDLVRFTINSEQIDSLLEQLIDTDLSNHAQIKIDALLHEYTSPIFRDQKMQHLEHISSAFNQPSVEAIFKELQKHDTEWHWQTLNSLKAKSPLSLKVTFAQIKKAKSMSMAECVQMDYCLVGHFMHHPDFYEGVRALLIDKDKKPKWQPGVLSEVSEDMVTSFFSCRAKELELA